MFKIKISKEDDRFDEKTQLPIWIIKFAGIVSALYTLKLEDWHFGLITVGIAILVYFGSKPNQDKHLFLALALIMFFGTAMLKEVSIKSAFIPFSLACLYCIFCLLNKKFKFINRP